MGRMHHHVQRASSLFIGLLLRPKSRTIPSLRSVCLISLQAGALRALPELDRETAEDLRRRQQSHDHASTSGPDDRPYRPQREPSALLSQQEGMERQHVLLRPPQLEKGRADSAMAPNAGSSASIWDSYDADEEAAVLAISSSPGIEYKAQSAELSKDRQSNSIEKQAQEARSGSAGTDHTINSQSRQHDSSESSGSEVQNRGQGSWEDDSSTDLMESLTRKTEEDMSPDLPLFM